MFLSLPLTILLPFLLIVVVTPFAVSSSLSTLAISHISNNITLVCALVPASSPCHASELKCTSVPYRREKSYSSGAVPFSGIAAGDDFLCGITTRPDNTATMRWWSFAEEEPEGKRVYRGPALGALAAGDKHVCALVGKGNIPTCWRWPELSFSADNFTDIAVGRDFVCGLTDSGAIKCFGEGAEVVGKEPAGNFSMLAAGSWHVCGVTTDGNLLCWGAGAPAVERTPPSIISLELGLNTTCVLCGNGTVNCWGKNSALPKAIADLEFVAIEAKGDAVCGILTANYSVVCWGSSSFQDKHIVVYERAMPGSCAPASTCKCGILGGSNDMCPRSSDVICNPCQVLPSVKASSSIVPANRRLKKVFFVVGAAGISFGLAALIVSLLYHIYSRNRLDTRVHDGMPLTPAALAKGGHGCREFSLAELSAATDGFSIARRVGSGSFGSVYRGTLADGVEVAIKRAERISARRRCRDAESAFLSELVLLSRVHHKNLVSLLGFCHHHGERILVFEFMSNGSLHDHLHHNDHHLSTWAARLSLALDAARGLEYLHTYAVPAIIHRDVKSSNILLDGEWNAKVSDFGLSLTSAREEEDTSGAAQRRRPPTAGTVGYMDPEYYRTGSLTERSDVYSFGVVLLEILTGRRAVEREEEEVVNVAEYAVPWVEAGEVGKVVDERVAAPRGRETEAVARLAALAAECVKGRRRDRPSMSEVVAELEWAVSLCHPGDEEEPDQDEMEEGSEVSESDSYRHV
ncbi:serine/threonine-protein kinase-like protein CCR4 [Typha angustifolia]|uniref:serine/threonine-protein kinase-like protein CCR4 n=1 Tax=Typha angustifolia TaxID=59011 RepID=UPI003C2F36A6